MCVNGSLIKTQEGDRRRRWTLETLDLAEFLWTDLDLAAWVIGALLGFSPRAVQIKAKAEGFIRRADRLRCARRGRKGINGREPMDLRYVILHPATRAGRDAAYYQSRWRSRRSQKVEHHTRNVSQVNPSTIAASKL